MRGALNKGRGQEEALEAEARIPIPMTQTSLTERSLNTREDPHGNTMFFKFFNN